MQANQYISALDVSKTVKRDAKILVLGYESENVKCAKRMAYLMRDRFRGCIGYWLNGEQLDIYPFCQVNHLELKVDDVRVHDQSDLLEFLTVGVNHGSCCQVGFDRYVLDFKDVLGITTIYMCNEIVPLKAYDVVVMSMGARESLIRSVWEVSEHNKRFTLEAFVGLYRFCESAGNAMVMDMRTNAMFWMCREDPGPFMLLGNFSRCWKEHVGDLSTVATYDKGFVTCETYYDSSVRMFMMGSHDRCGRNRSVRAVMYMPYVVRLIADEAASEIVSLSVGYTNAVSMQVGVWNVHIHHDVRRGFAEVYLCLPLKHTLHMCTEMDERVEYCVKRFQIHFSACGNLDNCIADIVRSMEYALAHIVSVDISNEILIRASKTLTNVLVPLFNCMWMYSVDRYSVDRTCHVLREKCSRLKYVFEVVRAMCNTSSV
ncbi:MAG: hypothetical protein PHN45_00055 [Methylococcales bacterium]|nr:hypothetical protein [Methylococcales bacterium]